MNKALSLEAITQHFVYSTKFRLCTHVSTNFHREIVAYACHIGLKHHIHFHLYITHMAVFVRLRKACLKIMPLIFDTAIFDYTSEYR